MKKASLLLVAALAMLTMPFGWNALYAEKRPYEYIEKFVEVTITKQIKEGFDDPVIIWAENDSIAWCKAYQKYLISEKTAKDSEEAWEDYPPLPFSKTPVYYTLLTPEKQDITFYVGMESFDERKAEIERSVASLPNYIKETREKLEREKIEEFWATAAIDSVAIDSLITHISVEKDEFDPKERVMYKPLSATQYLDMNGTYIYFTTLGGIPERMVWTVQYQSDSWLFIEKVQFAIDGRAYEYVPLYIKRDSGNGGRVWEWFKNTVNEKNRDIIKALASATSARIKFIGSDYYDILEITPEEIVGIRRCLSLYQAMGGELE